MIKTVLWPQHINNIWTNWTFLSFCFPTPVIRHLDSIHGPQPGKSWVLFPVLPSHTSLIKLLLLSVSLFPSVIYLDELLQIASVFYSVCIAPSAMGLHLSWVVSVSVLQIIRVFPDIDIVFCICIPTVSSFSNRRKQARFDSHIYLCYSHTSREICLLMCHFPW